MSGMNKVIIIGNLGKDPETNKDNTKTTFSIATSYDYIDKTTGKKEEKTEWHRIVCFGKLAINTSKYLTKGSKVVIDGSLSTRKYQSKKDNCEKSITEIIAQRVEFLDGAKKSRIEQTDHQGNLQAYEEQENKGNVIAPDDDIPF